MEFMSNTSQTVKTVNSCCVFCFIPISSTFLWNKEEKTLSSSFFQFLPGVLEEIGFSLKKPNPEIAQANF